MFFRKRQQKCDFPYKNCLWPNDRVNLQAPKKTLIRDAPIALRLVEDRRRFGIAIFAVSAEMPAVREIRCLRRRRQIKDLPTGFKRLQDAENGWKGRGKRRQTARLDSSQMPEIRWNSVCDETPDRRDFEERTQCVQSGAKRLFPVSYDETETFCENAKIGHFP